MKARNKIIAWITALAVILGIGLFAGPASPANAAWYWVGVASNSQTIKVQNLDGHQFNVAPGNGAWDINRFVVPAGKCGSLRWTNGSGVGYSTSTYGKSSVSRWVGVSWSLTHIPQTLRVYSC